MSDRHSFLARSESDTARLARFLADQLVVGDVIALSGDLGAGKTAFSRALIRSVVGDEDTDVPSPTFTLVQTYDSGQRSTIFHADLYRLGGPEDFEDLGLEDEKDTGIFLVEWPDRLPEWWRENALEIVITVPESTDQNVRLFTLSGTTTIWRPRLQKLAEKGFVETVSDETCV